MKKKHRMGWITSAGFTTILLAMTGFSICASLTTQQAANRMAFSGYLDDQYLQARTEISVEESLERKYRLEPGIESLVAYNAAATALSTTLHNIAQKGAAYDRVTVKQILTENRLYLIATHRMFAAVDAGNTARVIYLDHHTVDPVFTVMQQQVNTEAIRHNIEAVRNVTELAMIEHLVFVATLIVFPIGLILLAGLLLVVRTYRHKIDSGTYAEMIRLARTAFTDNLTDLGNHRAFQEDLRRLVVSASGNEESLSLALINIDGLKMINEISGHLEGDHILTTFATILRNEHRFDFMYRLNGDEFAVILPRVMLLEARNVMDQLRRDVEHGLFSATVSIGIASSPLKNCDIELLQEQAHLALSEAKRRCRNICMTFEEIREDVSLIAPAKVHALYRLLSQQRVDVAFQPIWDFAQDQVLSFEALTRPPAEYGFSGPQEIFDIAEKIGRAHELDYLCVHSILARAAELPSDALLFLNLTPQTLDHDVLTGSVLLEAVFSAGLTPDRLVLEITERSVVRMDVVVREAKKLRALGFRLALDDTGAGNAGLEMLSQLQVDFVKVDRTIVVKALTDATARAIFTGITAMAQQINSYVIAEGIEDVEMLDLVQQAGAQGAQGYLLGRPDRDLPNTQELQALCPSAQRAPLDLPVVMKGTRLP